MPPRWHRFAVDFRVNACSRKRNSEQFIFAAFCCVNFVPEMHALSQRFARQQLVCMSRELLPGITFCTPGLVTSIEKLLISERREHRDDCNANERANAVQRAELGEVVEE